MLSSGLPGQVMIEGMHRGSGCLRTLGVVAALVAGVVLGMIATHHNYRGEVHQPVSLALAGVTAMLVLLHRWPSTRPVTPARGTPVGRWCGRAVIRGSWLLRAGLAGYGAYQLTTELAVTFLPLLAGLAVATAVIRLLEKWGRHLAGFTADWGFLRGAAMVRYLLRVAVGAGVAGSSRILSHYWWVFLDSVPLAFYRGLRDTLGTAWLAGPATALACLLLYVILAVAATVVQRIIAQALGPGNAAGRWLAEHAAMTWVRAPEGTVIAGGPLLPFSYTSDFPDRPGRRTVARHRKRERPLPREEIDRLVDRIVEAAVAAAPDHPYLRLSYRAAGGYEEIVLAVATDRFRHWADRPRPEADAAPGPEAVRELPGFPARAALRRLRESAYRAGHGAPFTLHVTVDRPDRRRADPGHRYWRKAEWEWTEAGAPRPTWRRPPRPADYAADLRRFPAARRMVPLWLRQELGWRWLLPLSWGGGGSAAAGPGEGLQEERLTRVGLRRAGRGRSGSPGSDSGGPATGQRSAATEAGPTGSPTGDVVNP